MSARRARNHIPRPPDAGPPDALPAADCIHALRRSGERLAAVLAATRTALWEWNPVTRESHFSPTYRTMLGWAPQAFPAEREHWSALVHPDDWPAIRRGLRRIVRATATASFRHEFRMRGQDGGWRWILACGEIAERDGRGRVCRVIGVNADVTARKDEERQLRMSMLATESTGESVFWLDVDGRMLYVNPAAERELGYSAGELRRMRVSDIDPNVPHEVWGEQGELIRELRTRGLRKMLTVHRHRDGHLIPVEVESDPFHFDGQHYSVAIARDISERLASEQALRRSEAKFSAMFSLTPDPMALSRFADGVLLEVSRSFGEYFGYGVDELVGHSVLPGDLGMWPSAAQRRQWCILLEHSGEVRGFEAALRRRDGSTAVVLVSGKLVDVDGERCVIVNCHDITEKKEYERQLERVAHHDPLTGLPNRLLFGDRVRQAFAQSERAGTRVAVCYLDIDGFKAVNDAHGHPVGDQLLVAVATRLKSMVRGGDTVARLGGDEFVLLLSGLRSDEECRAALDRLLLALSAPHVLGDGRQLTISASIGVTIFPGDQGDPDTLVRHADHAMYAAKQAGKNRYQLFDTHLERRIEVRHATRERIAAGLAAGQFRLHYQPKVDCRLGRVVGAEALLRWQHPTLGLLAPGEFLPLIEDDPLAVAVGDWVIHDALRQLTAWRREGLELRVSINAFARQLREPDFVAGLAAQLRKWPETRPGQIEIEIVETAALEELEPVRRVIEECRALGVGFALDDFGTGYSSLVYLRHLPAQTIKIDQSFVRNMLTDAQDLAIVEAVIGLSRAFRHGLVGEGAETPAHVVRLLELGCDVQQGYALARPMAADDFARWTYAFEPDPVWLLAAGALPPGNVAESVHADN